MIWRLACAFCRSPLTFYDVNCFLISHSSQLASFKGWVLLDCGLFFLQPILYSFHNPTATFCHTTFVVLAVVLFNLCLLGLFGPAAYSSPNDSIWSLILYSCYFGLFLTHFIAFGLFYPISFFLTILNPFAFLGYP